MTTLLKATFRSGLNAFYLKFFKQQKITKKNFFTKLRKKLFTNAKSNLLTNYGIPFLCARAEEGRGRFPCHENEKKMKKN
jgi:hypothetical protein